ncbi:hypothetical protein M422DRAFT_39675 [Sphaerobolus stellatus SS14]|uniref:Uncharacterized protein n=1 Tax=Sphaerobolus stellatus (strain SS14) TaxID=990650 RepID=A0A0C9U2K6_SPHS4|nr:hypothetical protein M422DRAFT_39675 [Sphaerobolus stellatus SS14]
MRDTYRRRYFQERKVNKQPDDVADDLEVRPELSASHLRLWRRTCLFASRTSTNSFRFCFAFLQSLDGVLRHRPWSTIMEHLGNQLTCGQYLSRRISQLGKKSKRRTFGQPSSTSSSSWLKYPDRLFQSGRWFGFVVGRRYKRRARVLSRSKTLL